MWKFLEQRSFHLSESEYSQQLDAVAEYLNLWRVAQTVRAGIRSATPRGPGYTGGGGARAVGVLHPSHKHLQLDMRIWQCSAASHVYLSSMHAVTLQDCHSGAVRQLSLFRQPFRPCSVVSATCWRAWQV